MSVRVKTSHVIDKRRSRRLLLAAVGCLMFVLAPATASAAAPTICTSGEFMATLTDVVVPAGARCNLAFSTVSHDVTVEPGATLVFVLDTVGHDVIADHPRGMDFLGVGSVGHDVVINGLSGPLPIGPDLGTDENHMAGGITVGHDLVLENMQLDNGVSTCWDPTVLPPNPPYPLPCDLFFFGGDTVGHDMIVENNAGDGTRMDGSQISVYVDGLTVGHDLTVEGNTGADISNSTVGHDAICAKNGPQTGAGNTAGHNNSCPT